MILSSCLNRLKPSRKNRFLILLFLSLQIRSERYSRFTLQPAEDGERHVEVKLSDDGTEVEEEEQAGGSPSFRPALFQQQSRRQLCLKMTGIITLFVSGTTRRESQEERGRVWFSKPSLVFVSGLLIGYFSHSGPEAAPPSCNMSAEQTSNPPKAAETTTDPPYVVPERSDAQMDWADVTNLLTQKLSSQALNKTLRSVYHANNHQL